MIIDHIEKQYSDKKGGGIAYAFCNYDEQSLQTPQEIFESLLSQAVRHQEFINEALEQAYRDNSKRGHQLPLSEIFEHLKAAILTYPRTFVVIDALDEVLNMHQAVIVSSLKSLGHLSWMITSRPHLSIESLLQDRPF